MPTEKEIEQLRPDYVLLRERDLLRMDPLGWWQFAPHYVYFFDDRVNPPDKVIIMELVWLFAKVRPPKGSPSRKTWTATEVANV